MNIEELAKQIDALTPEQSLALFDSIVGLQERATKMRDEEAAAERERDERFPMCGCDKPATEAGFFLWYAVDIEPGIGRKHRSTQLRGGIVFAGDSDCASVPEQEDTQRINNLMWVKCGECHTFRAIENGFDLKVGEKW